MGVFPLMTERRRVSVMPATSAQPGRAQIRWDDRQWEVLGVDVERPLSADGFWWVSAFVVELDGELSVAELRVFPGAGSREGDWFKVGLGLAPAIGEWSGDPEVFQQDTARGISSSETRGLALGPLVDLARAEIEEMTYAAPATRLLGGRELELAARSRPGRAGHPPAYYLTWAVRYVQEIENGSETPNRDLAKKHKMPVAKVTRAIYDARHKYKLLTKPGKGKAGGELTAKAMELLKQLDDELDAAVKDIEQ